VVTDLAEPHKQLRISTNRGYFGSQRVFSYEAFPIFLFLFSSWCFLILGCDVESLTRQWGQLRQVRSKSEGRRSPTLCSLGNPFSLTEPQANDCCNSWHILGLGTESLYIDFCRHTTGVSAPCSGLVVFSVTASSKTEKRACGERILHFTAGGWGHGTCAWPEWQCAAYAWSKVHLQLVEFHCVGDGSW